MAGLERKKPKPDAQQLTAAASGAAKTGSSKKNPGRVRIHTNGLIVLPFLYDGRADGHGKYYGGYTIDKEKKNETVWDSAIKDENGIPIPFRSCGVLTRI